MLNFFSFGKHGNNNNTNNRNSRIILREDDQLHSNNNNKKEHKKKQQSLEGVSVGLTPLTPTMSESIEEDKIFLEEQKKQRIEHYKKQFPTLFKENLYEEDDDKVCPICLELYTNENPEIKCKCGHSFHFQCSEEWRQRSHECPVCFNRLLYEFEEGQLNKVRNKPEKKPSSSSGSAFNNHHHSNIIIYNTNDETSSLRERDFSNNNNNSGLLACLWSKCCCCFCTTTTVTA
ncbi:hypothetical protein ABK040_015837 [Willaertia magna]